MAWRIERFLIRGEIDNRIRDRVTGRLWFAGRAEPIELELYGNARRDLAGRRLEFSNPKPRPGLADNFATQQIGVVSEFTGSRKVRVPDIQLDDDPAHGQYRASVSWHGGNALYLEWFSLASGRVILQSTDYVLTIDPDSRWDMTDEEEKLQRIAHARAIELFNREIEFLSTTDENVRKDESEEMDSVFNAPVDEMFPDDERTFEFERGEDDISEKLADEIDRRENVEDDLLDESIAEEIPSARELVDPPQPGLPPLVAKARELTVRVLNEVEKNRWAPPTPCMHPVIDMVSSIAKAGGKISNALTGADWPPLVQECGECIVALRQASALLSSATLAADFCREANLVPRAWLRKLETDLLALRGDTDDLIAHLRDRLARGFD